MKRIFVFIILFIIQGALLFSADSNVTKIGGWGTGYYNDVFTRGNYAYIAADWNGLDIIDIKSPSKPITVGNVNLNSQAVAVHVNGNYAYVACWDGLHTVDISIPASPQAAGFYSLDKYYDWLHGISSHAVDIIADGNYAYLAFAGGKFDSCSIEILDVSNPSQPQSTGNSFYAGDYYMSNAGFPFQKNGNYLFYRTSMEYTLEIYDVSNPLSPRHKNTIASVDKFCVNGNYAYIVDSSDLKILNIADPTNSQQVGTCTINYDVEDIFAVGNYVYLGEKANQYQWQIQIIDVSTPTKPIVSGSCKFSGGLMELTVTGGTALAAAEGRGLYTFDVSKPASPRLLKNYDFSWRPKDIVVAGDRAYVADLNGELNIFDISAPTSPVLLGRYIASSSISAVSLFGNYAYLATSENGLEIIDVADPTKPVKAGVFCAGCAMKDVTINGNYAYYINSTTHEFAVLDLANPAAPMFLGHLETDVTTKINIDGNYALLAGENGVELVDITYPTSPLLISNFYGGRSSYVGGVCAQDSYAYVANNSNFRGGLDIFDFSRPSAPVRTGRYMMKDHISDLCVTKHYVYLAASSGLYIMDVSHPGSPSAAGYLAANVLV